MFAKQKFARGALRTRLYAKAPKKIWPQKFPDFNAIRLFLLELGNVPFCCFDPPSETKS